MSSQDLALLIELVAEHRYVLFRQPPTSILNFCTIPIYSSIAEFHIIYRFFMHSTIVIQLEHCTTLGKHNLYRHWRNMKHFRRLLEKLSSFSRRDYRSKHKCWSWLKVRFKKLASELFLYGIITFLIFIIYKITITLIK